MDRDTVVRLAREVGARMGFVSSTFTKQKANPANLIYAEFYAEELDRFATLVRNTALEEAACATILLDLHSGDFLKNSDPRVTCADAIRALKEQ